jgi:DNA-binding beta-propeller fold protein YncE
MEKCNSGCNTPGASLTINAKTNTIIARAPAGQYPDGLAYDPVERHVFVCDESGGVETVLNASGRRIATIPLGGEAGNVQYDAGSDHVLADVQTRDDVTVIDPKTNRIIRRIALPHCNNDHGLCVDSSRRLAFVACDQNATLPDPRPAHDDRNRPRERRRLTRRAHVRHIPLPALRLRREWTSQCSRRPHTDCGSSAKRSSQPKPTRSQSTPARTLSTSRSKAAQPAAPASDHETVLTQPPVASRQSL